MGIDWKYLKKSKFIGVLNLFKIQYIFGILTVITLHIFQIKIPELTGEITDRLLYDTQNTAYYSKQVITIILIGVIIAVSQYLWRYFIAATTHKVEYHLRYNFYDYLQGITLTDIRARSVGDLMSRCTNELSVIRRMIGPGVVMLLDFLLLTTFVIFRMLTTMDSKMVLFVLMPLPLIGISNYMIGNKLKLVHGEKQEHLADMTSYIRDGVKGMQTIKAFSQEDGRIKAYSELNRDYQKKSMAVCKTSALTRPVINLIYGMCLFLVLSIGGYANILGKLSLGEIVATIQYILLLIWPMKAIGASVNFLSMGYTSLKRYESIFTDATEDEKLTTAKRDEVDLIIERIAFKNVSYRYKNETKEAVNNISFEINKGEVIGIVGKIGCGKSTLLDLLLKFDNPSHGAIEINSYDVRHYTCSTIRNHIGYVTQETELLSKSIDESIRFMDESYTVNEVQEAIKQAELYEEVCNFEAGIDTMLGEGGVNISGGQKQRISIARALLRDYQVLVLDNPFSAIDANTEKCIVRNLIASKGNRTIIIATHRIESLLNTDRVVVMENGSINDIGEHNTLLAKNSLYKSLFIESTIENDIDQQGGDYGK